MKFKKIGKISEIKENKGKLFSIEEKKIAVFRHKGKFYAIESECPHMQVDLSKGNVEDLYVECPGHGWRFNLETGKHEIMPVSVKTYETKVEGEDLFVKY